MNKTHLELYMMLFEQWVHKNRAKIHGLTKAEAMLLFWNDDSTKSSIQKMKLPLPE